MGDRLQGKIALVTGVGGGIGKACALRFAEQGAIVVGADINADMAHQTAAEARERGLDMEIFAPCDLTQAADVRRYVETAGDRHGRIDLLLNAAAIPPHMASAAAMDYDDQWTPARRLAGATEGEVRDRPLARIPMRRFGQPDDIAWCAVYLASDEASWVTGANFPIDGGVMAV